MSHRQVFLLVIFGVAVCGASACGRTTEAPEETDSSSNAGANASGGARFAPNGGAPTSGGAPNVGGSTGGTESKHPKLDILSIEEAALDTASLDELFELAAPLAVARGYSLCTCRLPPDTSNEALDACSRDESGLGSWVNTSMTRRCVRELSGQVTGFEDTLRCELKTLRQQGLHFALCSEEGTQDLPEPLPCSIEPNSSEYENLTRYDCLGAFYCEDDELHRQAHCNKIIDCTSQNDEEGCAYLTQARHVRCGEKIMEASLLCESFTCPEAHEAGLCVSSSEQSYVFACADGTTLPAHRVCDGVTDCSTDEDELSEFAELECF